MQECNHTRWREIPREVRPPLTSWSLFLYAMVVMHLDSIGLECSWICDLEEDLLPIKVILQWTESQRRRIVPLTKATMSRHDALALL